MTAIFMVWNTSGLAIAADQSASVKGLDESGNQRVLFTENVRKIFKPENHNFAVASAGSSTVNNVPIEGILSQWIKTTEKKDSLLDYLLSFISWLVNESNLDSQLVNLNHTKFRMRQILRAILDNFKSNQITVNHREHIDSQFDAWENSDLSNFFGNSPERSKYGQFREELKDTHNEILQLIDPLLITDEVRESNLEKLQVSFRAEFETVFEESFDENIDWHCHIRDRTTLHLLDYADSNWSFSHLMFVGYGETDWIPKCVKIMLFDFDTEIPVLVIDDASDPYDVWYEELAQEEAVSKFFRPIDRSARKEITNRLEMNFAKDNIYADIDSIIDSVLDEYLGSMTDMVLKKINQLTVDKLQFIAEHMVAMESFRSYIEEYLPTVGGQVDCVKLSRVDGEFD